MAQLLRRVVLLITVALLGLQVAPAFAECTPATVYTGDCDFKNEDTHLWLIQPGHKFQSDDDTDELVNDAWTAIYEYYSTTKTLGDDAIRDSIDTMREAIQEALYEAVASLAGTLINDPIDLKPLYTDYICDVFWGAVLDRDCATTSELVLDAERVWDLTEVLLAIYKLQAEQFLFLGEEWGDIAVDIAKIKEQFDELETIGQNLEPDEVAEQVEQRFPGYREVLAGPKTTQAAWIASRREISATLHATMGDTLAGVSEISRQVQDDRTELEKLTGFSRDSVGRMQQFELGNMTGTQANQEWLKISELMLMRGNLEALDMASDMNKQSVQFAEGERARRQLPTVGTVIGNEIGAILP